MDEIVTLNVGGCIYTTSKGTLLRYPQSMLGVMFSTQTPLAKDKDGHYWIDGNGEIFRYVLDFLRRGCLTVPVDFTDFALLETEAEFYKLPELIKIIRSRKDQKHDGAQRSSDFVQGVVIAVEYKKNLYLDNIDEVHISGPKVWISELGKHFGSSHGISFENNCRCLVIPYYNLLQTVLIQAIMNMGFRVYNTMPSYHELKPANIKQWFVKDQDQAKVQPT